MPKIKISKSKKEGDAFWGYRFSDISLLQTALTHASCAAERHCADNERMEFLGDAVLELCISEYLYESNPRMREGEMTKTRAKYVCEDALYACAVATNLPGSLLLGGAEDRMGGRNKPSILSDALEAVIGAVFLDGGYMAARGFIRESLLPYLLTAASTPEGDYKTRFQEYVQGRMRGAKIAYELVEARGPDHLREFTMCVSVDGKPLGKGSGKSKQSAGQQAAKCALATLLEAENHGKEKISCD